MAGGLGPHSRDYYSGEMSGAVILNQHIIALFTRYSWLCPIVSFCRKLGLW